ncbi:hypothetical protein SBC1_73050 (plasmid) [Caballeronia sp. SBC1]|nr:hypothetical protein SBC2_73230 [Caballeronia sp. SBC2]QIN67258.1 hypothetical protein SBC1_73050 [Caballeronia sp. SBC1]
MPRHISRVSSIHGNHIAGLLPVDYMIIRTDINTVRAWLGHVSIDTTNISAEIDLETKANALARLNISSDRKANKRWTKDPVLMAFLRSL